MGDWGCWKSVSVSLSPLLDWEGRRGEEAVGQSGRDKEKGGNKSHRLLFLIKREEREVLILAWCAGPPEGGM